jgi:NAD(P)-dependent dehydrogenase (short-subunit alcohol dehydrogenase family)
MDAPTLSEPRKRSSSANKPEVEMLLENKNAVIYGAGGAIGSAVARAFAREGAKVFPGRTLASLEAAGRGHLSGGRCRRDRTG